MKYLLLLLSGCGLIKLDFHGKASQVVVTNSTLGGGCFDPSISNVFISVREVTNGKSLPAGACIERLDSFALSAHIDEIRTSQKARETCEGPTGTLTLHSFTLSYEDKQRQHQALTVDCDDVPLDVTQPPETLQPLVNTCLARIAAPGAEFFRHAINQGADVFAASAVGDCTPIACFNIRLTLTAAVRGEGQDGGCRP